MSLRRYALERIVATVGVLFLALVVVFLICHVAGPPKLGPGPQVDSNYLRYAHESFGDYLWRLIAHQSFARPFFSDASVASLIFKASTVTLSLVGWALFLGLLVAVPLGVLWDRRPRWTVRPASVFVYLAISAQLIWVGLWASYLLGYRTHVFPLADYADFFNPPHGQPGGPIQWAYHLILPGLVLGLPVAAIYTRVIRALSRNVRHAGAEAAPADRAEAVRNARSAAFVVLLKGLLRDVGFLIGLAVFVESVFQLPGLARLVLVGDTPVVEGALIVATLVAVAIHLAGNLIGGAVSEQWRAGS